MDLKDKFPSQGSIVLTTQPEMWKLHSIKTLAYFEFCWREKNHFLDNLNSCYSCACCNNTACTKEFPTQHRNVFATSEVLTC